MITNEQIQENYTEHRKSVDKQSFLIQLAVVIFFELIILGVAVIVGRLALISHH